MNIENACIWLKLCLVPKHACKKDSQVIDKADTTSWWIQMYVEMHIKSVRLVYKMLYLGKSYESPNIKSNEMDKKAMQ